MGDEIGINRIGRAVPSLDVLGNALRVGRGEDAQLG
jgi:hypothetical protein